jgi:hypothetical protein
MKETTPTPAFGRRRGDAPTVWSRLRSSVLLRRTDGMSGAAASTLTRAEVLGLAARLRALSGHPAPARPAAPDPSDP